MKPKTKIITGVVLLLFSFIITSKIDVSAQSFPTVSYREVAILGKGSASKIFWHPNGQSIVVGGTAGIWVYDSNLDQIARLEPPDQKLLDSFTQSPDGSMIVAKTSTVHSQTLYIWNLSTLTLQTTIQLSSKTTQDINWSLDNTRIAVIEEDKVGIWNVSNGTLVTTFSPPEYALLTYVTWRPNRTEISVSSTKATYIWNTQTGQLLSTVNHIGPLTWNSDGSYLAIEENSSIIIWNGISSQLERIFSAPSEVNTVVWLPASNSLSAGYDDGVIRIWEVKSPTPIRTLSVHTDMIFDLIWSSDGQYFTSNGRDEVFRIWDTTTWQVRHTFNRHNATLHLQWHSDNQRIALVVDQDIRLLNAISGSVTKQRSVHNRFVGGLDWSPDGTKLVIGEFERIRVRDATTGNILFTHQTTAARELRWSPDGARIAGFNRASRFILDANTGQILRSAEDFEAGWSMLDWSPDSQRVLFADARGKILVWNVVTDEIFGISGPGYEIKGVKWSPDGTKIASAGIRREPAPVWALEITLWNATDGAFLTALSYDVEINQIAWHPDGNRIAALSANRQILLSNVTTGGVQAELDWSGKVGDYSHLQWSGDGTTLTALNIGSIITWNTTTGQITEYGVLSTSSYHMAVYGYYDKIAVVDDRFLIHVLVREDRTTVSDIGNYVWHDSNGNGLQEIDEPGLQRVTVNLLRNNFSIAASTSTNNNGKYSFLDIPPGDYYIEIIPPADTYTIAPVDRGTDDARDSDFDWRDNFGTPDPNDRVLRSMRFTASEGMQRDDVDAGFMPNSDLDVRVWRDTDGDGVQDTGEQGMAGVSLFLRRANFTRYRDPLTTDSDGFATFTNLPAGDYYVQITVPSGYSLAPFNIGPDDNIDNDFAMAFDYETGSGNVPRTLRFTLAPGVLRENIDAGLKQP